MMLYFRIDHRVDISIKTSKYFHTVPRRITGILCRCTDHILCLCVNNCKFFQFSALYKADAGIPLRPETQVMKHRVGSCVPGRAVFRTAAIELFLMRRWKNHRFFYFASLKIDEEALSVEYMPENGLFPFSSGASGSKITEGKSPPNLDNGNSENELASVQASREFTTADGCHVKVF